MSRELRTQKHGATSNINAMDVAKTLLKNGYQVVVDSDARSTPTAKKAANYVRKQFGQSAAFSKSGQSVILHGLHAVSGARTEVFVRVATANGQRVGRLRDDEITAIEFATGLFLTV